MAMTPPPFNTKDPLAALCQDLDLGMAAPVTYDDFQLDFLEVSTKMIYFLKKLWKESNFFL